MNQTALHDAAGHLTRILFTAAFLLLTAGPLSAQNLITGRVSDLSSVPLPDVSVALLGFASTAETDAEGLFEISAPDTGTFSVQFTRDGYVPLLSLATVAEDTALGLSSLEVRMAPVAEPVDIGPGGGVISGPNGESLVIPPGALDVTTPISFTVVPADATTDAPSATSFEKYTLRLTGFNLSPAGLQFNLPVTLTLPVPDEGIYAVEERDPAMPNFFIARFVDPATGDVTPDMVPVLVDPATKTASLSITHFSEIIIYDDFGIGDWWAHWVEIRGPQRVVLFENFADCNCQQDVCQGPDVEFSFTEEKGFTVTVGAEADFGLTSEVSVRKLATLGSNYGIKFSAELTNSWSQTLGTTITFEGATYSPPPRRQGRAITRVVAKQITYTFYELFLTSNTPTVVGQFVLTYDLGVEHVAPPLAEQNRPICELLSVSPAAITIQIADIESGLASIRVVETNNCTVALPSFPSGTTDFVTASATKSDPTRPASVTLEVRDICGNVTTCDPVLARLAAELPLAYALDQNYPNPFNPSTRIRVQLPEQGHAKLAIYDVTGRKVAILLDEAKEAGVYEVEWDGTNTQGYALPSGLYVYVLRVGTFEEARTMTLIR